uniref:LITAF domain-containing protein n=1 Tax=Meloidogyne hapla TaxID=6305 RepID=A0A1I8C187_MELHA
MAFHKKKKHTNSLNTNNTQEKESSSSSVDTSPTQESKTKLSNQQQQLDVPQKINNNLGPFPQEVYCPSCCQQVVTQIEHVSGVFTCVCFCGCCLIPLCLKGCKDVVHRCSQCNKYIGTFERVPNCAKPQEPPLPAPQPPPTPPQSPPQQQPLIIQNPHYNIRVNTQ